MNAVPSPPLAPVPPALKLRRRIKGAAIGLAVGAFLYLSLLLLRIVPTYFQVRRDAPRLAAFNQQCGHPVIGNPATFDHASAGQSACEAFPAVVKASSWHSPYERKQWRYSLSIGKQVVQDNDGREWSGNPETIGDVTENLSWKDDRPVPVYALFWKGVLMSIYSRKDGSRMQTLSNPSTARQQLKFWASGLSLTYPLYGLAFIGAFFGYMVAETKIETDENGPSLSVKANAKANAERRALLLSDEAALQATGRNAVWMLQGLFAGSQAWMIGLGLTAYNQALHPPKFAVPAPFASPDPLLVGGAVALSVSLLALATLSTFRYLKLNPPFPSFHTVKVGAWNAMAWAHIGWAPLVFASIETHNSLFLVAGELAIWAFVQLLLVPHYRAFWRAVLEEARAQKSPLQRAI